MLESKEIGLKLFTFWLDPLFLKIGITLTILREDGKIPVSNVNLINKVKISVSSLGINLKTYFGMLKSPVLLEKFSDLITLLISDLVTAVKKKELDDLSPVT